MLLTSCSPHLRVHVCGVLGMVCAGDRTRQDKFSYAGFHYGAKRGLPRHCHVFLRGRGTIKSVEFPCLKRPSERASNEVRLGSLYEATNHAANGSKKKHQVWPGAAKFLHPICGSPGVFPLSVCTLPSKSNKLKSLYKT